MPFPGVTGAAAPAASWRRPATCCSRATPAATSSPSMRQRQAAVALAHRQHLERAADLHGRRPAVRARRRGRHALRVRDVLSPVISSKRIGMGLVGAGFVGPHHIDAVRRLGFVDVVALASVERRDRPARRRRHSAFRKATGITRRCSTIPTCRSCTTPRRTHLHYPVIAAALARGKHVVSDKPLAMTAADARALVDQARRAGVIHAVTFNYRGNPLVQQARRRIARGEHRSASLSARALFSGLADRRNRLFLARSSPSKGGASSAVADIGSHWCDLAEHVSGLRIVASSRRSLDGHSTIDEAGIVTRGVCRERPDGPVRSGGHQGRGPGVRSPAFRQRRDRQRLGRSGLRRTQERPRARGLRPQPAPSAGGRNIRTSCGSVIANEPMKSCRRTPRSLAATSGTMRGCRAGIRRDGPTHSRNVIARHLRVHRCRQGPGRLASADVRDLRRRISRGTDRRGDSRQRQSRRLDASMSIRPFEPIFMPVGILTAALQELTPQTIRDADPDRAIEDWLAFARELGADAMQLSAALHPSEADVPPEAMLDPVANTLDLRQPFDKDRARRVEAALPPPVSAFLISATSTICCTTIRRSGGRSVSSCSGCSMPRCCWASTRFAASSAATSGSAWTRT